MWTPQTPPGAESLKIKWELVPYTSGVGLDLGCGPVKPFPHFIGVDSNVDRELFGIESSARNLTGQCDKLPLFADETMDFVFSSHLLEHIPDFKAALAEWWRVIRPGGHLCLYLPHKELYPNIGTPGANPDHKHDFMPADIVAAMKEIAVSFDLVRNEDRNEGDEYSFFQVYKKLPGKKKADRAKQVYLESYLSKKPEKTLAFIRYGAYGDMLQSAALLPALKAQGYHITWFCSTRGHEVVKHDPHVDEWVVQEEDQVPQNELSEFFTHLETKYTRVLNLCEAVEGTLLPDPGRSHFFWSKAARHAFCDHNYLEMQFKMADLPFDGAPPVRFHPTQEEVQWAREQRAKCPGPVVAWALAGSAVHKVWPHVDTVMARILLAVPSSTIVLTGGPREKDLGHPWRREPRVWNRAGAWTIRQTLAFAQVADLVVGPETGLLNAVSMEKLYKVLILSHSSVKNLCRDWVNTIALAAEKAPCYPCHRLHTAGWAFCNRDKEGGALCATMITADHVWRAVKDCLAAVIASPISDEFDAADVVAHSQEPASALS